MITFKLSKNKKMIISILSNPRIYKETYGIEYKLKDRVHIAYQNYLILYNNHILGLLQFDKFISNVCIMHGCILPQFRKKSILLLISQHCKELLKGHFKKVLFTIPEPAKHMINFSKKLGFKEEGRIKNGTEYNNKTVDCILMSYEVSD